MKISIIGAGIGGLAAAALLSARDHDVQVFEKNEQSGGKMNEFKAGGYRFDTGPSLLTMPFVLEDLFRECGAELKDFLTLEPVEPVCRYFWQDGTQFNCWSDVQKTCDEIRLIAPDDIHAYKPFLSYSEKIYNRTADAFLFNPLQNWKDFAGLNFLDLMKIDALTTVSKRVDSQFKSKYLRQFFKRFTTYNGSSPYQAPATLNVIPHVELNMGGFYIKGGLYELAKALQKLAEKNGARFHFNKGVSSISVENRKANGLHLDDETTVSSEIVLSNSDATETSLKLLSDDILTDKQFKKIEQTEPSCSGFVVLLGVKKRYEQLVHHNIFFSDNYEQEFKDIFQLKVMPSDPTIYVANTSYSDLDHAPDGGSNLFILVNAPYISENYNWSDEKNKYADFLLDALEKRGLKDLRKNVEVQEIITPDDFYEKYKSNKGSIYGTSSNSKFAAFARPRNKSPYVENLYLAGGSTHPGGGIPLCILSAQHAVQLIERDYK